MNRLWSTLLAGMLAASVSASGVVPSGAAPLVPPPAGAGIANGDVVNVAERRFIRRGGGMRHHRGGHYRGGGMRHGGEFRRGGHWRGNGGKWHAGRHGGGYYRRGHGWHDGYPGYRYWGPGFYDDFWYPGAAIITGAIVAGALANDYPPDYAPNYYGGNAHVRWCYNRYRSYRVSDNTFQPYHGLRRQCLSPY